MEEEHAAPTPVAPAAASETAVAPTTAATAATSAASEAALSASTEVGAAETTTTGAGESSIRRRSSKHHRKGGKKHHEKAQASDINQSQPQQQLTGVDGVAPEPADGKAYSVQEYDKVSPGGDASPSVTQAASGTTLPTSPSLSSDKALSPQPPEPQAAVDVPKAAVRAGEKERLVVSEHRDSPQPTASTSTGLLEYWPLVATIVVLVVVILLQLLIAAPLRLQRAPQAHHVANVCESEPCRHYAQLFAGAMNLSAPPCDNFYAHVCGRWDASHSRKGDSSVLAESWRRLARRAASRLSMVPDTRGKPEPMHRVSQFIYTCLSIIEVPRAPEIKEVLERGNITWPKRNERPDFLGALFYMARRMFIPVAFDVATLETDERATSTSRTQTLFFGLPSRFLAHARALARLRRSGRLLDHLHLTYETLELALNETRLKEIASHFGYLGDFFARYEAASDYVTSSANASFFLQYTPSVSKVRWDALTKRYFNVSLIDDEDDLRGGVVIQGANVFSAVFEVHAKLGEHLTDDIVGGLCVQALVDYTSSDLLASLLGGSRELATESVYDRCFSDAYRFYGSAVDAYFHPPLSREVMFLRRVATLVHETFSDTLRRHDTMPGTVVPGSATKDSSSTPPRKHRNFDLALSSLYGLNTKMLADSYDHYPPETDSSLEDWMRHAAFASIGGKSPTGESLWESLNEDVGRAAGRFRNFRLRLAHMEDPFYAVNVSAAVLMAGVGARLAAALFYDHVAASSLDDPSKAYTENQECLFPGTGGGSSDLEIQGAVASIDVAWSALKAASGARSSSGTAIAPWDSGAGLLADEELFFSFFCYLFCGEPDGERLCNVPLRHSSGFSRVFRCEKASAMNPEQKCRMGST
ncbi:hypothetical protein HPB49_013978 [Dermacentor silvarum]|uniref:Uncharacterized protein n=1 Tax=Dermacentor silvarum TaxID=543639 RepID=A0ACB8DPN4_DERSI|nr:hypothetical protein HPB49_013978 [Dermacentor silvarum]